MAKSYRLIKGGLHEEFLLNRSKIQVFGGGFGNGKTAAVTNKGLILAKDYPGSNGLVARSTYPKLNDTIRKAWLEEWCPKDWVKRKPTKDDNTLLLKNGTTVNFRYIAQRGKMTEEGDTSSNLLSANYDWIIVDQIEDPEITHKDFIDLMGRLRGAARYIGDDPTMPTTGPRWMILTANPSMNWVYKKLVKPLELYKSTGAISEDLIVDPDTGKPMISLFEGSTYENKHNLEADYIRGLEATFRGQARERYLLGKWGAFEGLVYPAYDPRTHVIEHSQMLETLAIRAKHLRQYFYVRFSDLSGYDYGLASPACYLLAAADPDGIVCILDGFYVKEKTVKYQAELIEATREPYKALFSDSRHFNFSRPFADPQIFKRTSDVGETVSARFAAEGIPMQKAMNGIASGIQKVTELLAVDPLLVNPFTGKEGSPRLFFSSRLDFLSDEIVAYHWKNEHGTATDAPVDRNDHAMDTLRYILTRTPVQRDMRQHRKTLPGYFQWQEREAEHAPRGHRYG